MNKQQDFDKLVNALNNTKANCTLKLTDKGEILALCGWNYPDELCYIIDDEAEKLNIRVDISADVSGYKYTDSKRINRGPQSY